MNGPDRNLPMACSFCRKRKLRCDKKLPRCQSCIRLGKECIYLSQRPTLHRPRTDKRHIQELEQRLGRVESLLRDSQRASNQSNSDSPSPSNSDENAMSGGNHKPKPLDAETMRDLEQIYFEGLHLNVPIIHRGRYSSRAPTGDTEPPLYLRYAIMAVAALGADRYSHLSNEYYTNSRHLAELAGLNDPRGRHSTIPRVQTWLHLALYDLICARWALSWTNTSQAIRLLQIANVHNLDHTDPSLARNKCRNSTWSEAEEKRRAFWLAFCLDRSAFLTQGLPHLIDNRDIHVLLPASESAYQSSIEEPSITLCQATSSTNYSNLSTMSASAVLQSMCNSKIKHLQQLDSTAIKKLFVNSSWLENGSADEDLTAVFCVPTHLIATKANMEANLFYVNVLAHSSTICVHQLAVKLVRTCSSPHVAEFIQRSTTKRLKAAWIIYKLATVAIQSNITIHHPGTAICIYNALVTFAECFTTIRDPKHGKAIRFLLAFINSLCLQSQISCSLCRDFEAEYPLLNIEFGPESNGTCNTVSSDESPSSSSPLAVSSEFELPPNIPNQHLSIQVRSGDLCSLGTDLPQYDWSGSNFWDTQVIDADYTSFFQNAPDVRLDIQRINSPAQPAAWINNRGAI